MNHERYARLFSFRFVHPSAELTGIVRRSLSRAASLVLTAEEPVSGGTVPLSSSSSSSTRRRTEADNAARGDRDLSSDIELDIRVRNRCDHMINVEHVVFPVSFCFFPFFSLFRFGPLLPLPSLLLMYD